MGLPKAGLFSEVDKQGVEIDAGQSKICAENGASSVEASDKKPSGPLEGQEGYIRVSFQDKTE